MDMLERGFVAMAATCLVILVGLTTLLALSPEDSVPEKVLQTLTVFHPTPELAAGGLGHRARPSEPRR